MPQVTPSPGDKIEVFIGDDAGKLQTFIGTVYQQTTDGKHEVLIECEPQLRGKVSINEYMWSHEAQRWQRRSK